MPGTNEIDSIKTSITLIEGGKEVLSGDIEMNGPVIYKGIAFYHMSHGQMPMGLVLRSAGSLREG